MGLEYPRLFTLFKGRRISIKRNGQETRHEFAANNLLASMRKLKMRNILSNILTNQNALKIRCLNQFKHY